MDHWRLNVSEIRYDALHDTHVIIAPERLHRPDTLKKSLSALEQNDCPFCEGHESMTPKEIFALRSQESLSNQTGWKTRVVPNLYKALAIEAPYQQHDGAFSYWDGFGAHEVIIDTPHHKISMMEWTQEERVLWVKTLQQRVEDLRRDSRLAYISLFKNEGYSAGSTMEHSHTQLIALPIIPQNIHRFNQHAINFYHHHHVALMESILNSELKDASRIVASCGEFIAYCPYASSYPGEVMISSKNYIGQIDTIIEKDIEDLALLLGIVLDRLNQALGDIHFNLSLSTPPLSDEGGVKEAHRLCLRIMPRLYRFGGFETSTQMMINPFSPEYAAKLLRGGDHV